MEGIFYFPVPGETHDLEGPPTPPHPLRTKGGPGRHDRPTGAVRQLPRVVGSRYLCQCKGCVT